MLIANSHFDERYHCVLILCYTPRLNRDRPRQTMIIKKNSFYGVKFGWRGKQAKHLLIQHELKLCFSTAAHRAVAFVCVLLNCQTHESLALICRLTACQLRQCLSTGGGKGTLHVPCGFVVFRASCISIFFPPPHVNPGANKTEDCG